MDEIEYKLKKNNPVLAAQSITKLVDIIKNKYIDQQNLSTERQLDIPELKLLRDKCSDYQNIVSLTACQGMVHLVEEGFLQVPSTLSDFIAALSSTKNYAGIIQGIGNLLLHDMIVQVNYKKEYECSFSISSPQHPLITILRQHNSTWTHVINQIQYLFSHHDPKIVKNSFILLRPVIIYILCDPCTDVPEKCRSETWNILVRLSTKSNVQDYILDLFPWIQSPESILLKRNLILELIETAYVKNMTTLYIGLLPYLASLAHEIISNGEDPRPCLSTLNKIIIESKSTEANNYVLFIFCETFVICPSIYLEYLVRICSKIIKLGNINPIICEMVISSFLQWMIYPSIMLKTPLEIAHDTIKYVHKNYKIDQKTENTLKILSNKWFVASMKTDGRIQRTATLVKLCESFRSSQKSIIAWFKRIVHCQKIVENLLPLIFGIFITDYNNSELSDLALQILLNVVKYTPELGVKVLILILHKLSKEHNPKIQLYLLRSIPEMAVLKENVPLVVHTLESIENGPRDLQAMSIDLYTRLWKIQVRCYPYLQRVLLQPPKNQNSSTELDIVKAIALKEICLLRPEHHGTEIVSLLSSILNRCGDTNGSFASALALEGITALCKTSIVDIGSTWKALSPKLTKDKRPLVIESLCKLFSEVPILRTPTHEYENLEHDIIAKLWSYITTTDNIEIITAAFQALSSFSIQNFTLKQIPPQFSQNLKLPAQYTKTPIDAMRKPEDVLLYIPGECWIQLLQNVNEKGLDAACNYLISCVKEEISEYRSKVYSVQQGQGEPFNYNASLPAKSIVRALATYLIYKAANLTNDSKRDITNYCLKILSQDYDKPLPPLNWCFLHELFHLGLEERKLCIIITAKQSITSGTAQRFIENYVVTFKDFDENEEEILTLYSVLRQLAKTVQPSSLKQFLDNSFKYAFDKCYSQTSTNSNQAVLLKTILALLKTTLLDSTIHDANRNLISLLLESYLENFFWDDEIFNDYADCVIELSQVFIERMTSPTVWWVVNDEKLQKAILIRKKMALRTDIEKPLVWFNECIDAVMSYPSQQIFTLRQIYEVLCKNKNASTAVEWYLELMGRTQSILLDKDNTEASVEFFLDVFILVVITLSEYDCLTVSDDAIIISRELRISLLPQATLNLLESKQWESTVEETIDFYLHMMSAEVCAAIYRNMFRDGLIALKNAKHFKKHSVWMRCLSKLL